MKLSGKNKLVLAAVAGCAALVFAFQNCSSGFEVLKLSETPLTSSTSFDPLDVPKVRYTDGEHVVIGDQVMPTNFYKYLQTRPVGPVENTSNLPSGIVTWPAGRISVHILDGVIKSELQAVPAGSPVGTKPMVRATRVRRTEGTEYNDFRNQIAAACEALSAVANITCVFQPKSDTVELTENALTIFMLAADDAVWCGSKTNVSCSKVGGPGMMDNEGTRLTKPWLAMRFADRLNKNLIMHELGHTLGLLHEHQRSDAPQYLLLSPAILNNPNLSAQDKAEYFVHPNFTPDSRGGFDFGSLMMYNANGELNAEFLAGSTFYAIRKEFYADHQREVAKRGQNVGRPSARDVAVLRALYGSPTNMAGKASCPFPGREDIPHGSYISVYSDETTDPNTGVTKCATTTARLCDNGQLSGAGEKLRCNFRCSAGGVDVAYAFSRDFFQAASVPAGQTCQRQTRTCSNSGLSVPAGATAFTAASCTVQNPAAPPVVRCLAGSTNIDSAVNGGQKNTCLAAWPDAVVSANRVNATVTNGGTYSAVCADGGNGAGVWRMQQSFCPPPASQPPGTPPVTPPTIECAAGSDVFESAANNVGAKTTCTAAWMTALAGNAAVVTSVSNGGSYSALCGQDRRWYAIQKSCPAPANEPPPPPPPPPGQPNEPAVLACNVTSRYLQAYSMSAIIKPATVNVSQPGYFFVAGYDVGRNQWWTFDGREWVAYRDTIASIATFGRHTTLVATGVNEPVFSNADLTQFPNGQIYVGYGVGGDKQRAWDEMIGKVRYKLCDILPMEREECIDRVGNRIPGCIPR